VHVKAVAEVEKIEALEQPAGQMHARFVSSSWKRALLTFLMVAGPGLIVMEADNDAGAVSTYVQAGAQYGTHLLWLLLLLLPITYFVQEMVARLGSRPAWVTPR
jgi:Mn2+/Fe2+ NRAMP family transporter